MTPERLPRRDYLLLPLIALATVLVLLAGGEVMARLLWVQVDDAEPCEFTTATGYRYTPFCTSRTKVWEGPWISQHFNACGYRTEEPCAPRPEGSLRVAVLGSSTARGALVSYDESFAARASATLTAQCQRKVDFQNLGTEPADDSEMDLRVPEALALRPSAIAIVIGPFDLLHIGEPRPDPAAPPPHEKLTMRSLVLLLRESRLFLLMQYYLYRDPAFQVHAFLLNADAADYVRAPLSEAWRQRVVAFGAVLQRIAAQTGPAHVPVVLEYVPERAQAALAAEEQRPPGVDPFLIGRALRQEAARFGIETVDATAAFAAEPDFGSLFYLTDGHPRGGGHAAIAQALVPALRALPPFAACRPEQAMGRRAP